MQRKKYSQELKDQVVKEAIEVGNASIVARKHDLSCNLVNRWVREHKNPCSTNANSVNVSSFISNKALATENDKLKKLLGEIAILRDLVKKRTHNSR